MSTHQPALPLNHKSQAVNNPQLTDQNAQDKAKCKLFLSLQTIKGFGTKSLSYFYSFTQNQHINWENKEEIYYHLMQAFQENKRLKCPTKQHFLDALININPIITQYQKQQIIILPKWSPDYPTRLASVQEAPIFFFLKGNLKALNAKHSVAIIGTRFPTKIGFQAGTRLGEVLAQNGFLIVSGLAKGCDTVGHQGSLNQNGQTVAVLAHGLDQKTYPAENHALAERILAQNGALISEYPLGTKCNQGYFVQRDRWQAGLSDAVILIESDAKGGSNHTIRFAKSFHRKIACFYLEDNNWLKDLKSEINQYLLQQEEATKLSTASELKRFIEELKQLRT